MKFDKSRKLDFVEKFEIKCIFKFSFKYLCSFTADKDFPCSIKFLHGSLKSVSGKI